MRRASSAVARDGDPGRQFVPVFGEDGSYTWELRTPDGKTHPVNKETVELLNAQKARDDAARTAQSEAAQPVREETPAAKETPRAPEIFYQEPAERSGEAQKKSPDEGPPPERVEPGDDPLKQALVKEGWAPTSARETLDTLAALPIIRNVLQWLENRGADPIAPRIRGGEVKPGTGAHESAAAMIPAPDQTVVDFANRISNVGEGGGRKKPKIIF